jgi:hypothetical protein
MSDKFRERIAAAVPYLRVYFDRSAKYMDTSLTCQEFLLDALFKIGVDDSEIGVEVLDSEVIPFEDFRIALSSANIPIARLMLCWEKLCSKKSLGEKIFSPKKPGVERGYFL